MSKFTGRQVKLGIARETSRGTGVTPSFWLPFVDFSFDEKVNTARIQSGVGVLADSEQVHVLTKYAQGSIGCEARDKSIGLLLYSLLGTVATTGPTDSAYTHAFSLDDSMQHDSLTFTVVDKNTTEQYRLVMLDKLELSQTVDDVLRVGADFTGKTSKGASATATYAVENKFTKKHMTFKVATNLAGLAAASTISLKSMRITFSQNLLLDDYIGTAEPEDVLNQNFSIEGEFVLPYESETWKEYMRGNTYMAMEVKWTNTDSGAVIGAGTSPSLTFQFPRVDFIAWEPNYNNDELTVQTVSFKCNHDVSGGNSIVSTATLINAQASY
jgi:hypothetical protein